MRSPFARHVLPLEKVDAIRAALRLGMTCNSIAGAVGCNRKTVMAYRRQIIDAELQRAYDVLWDGDGEACDEITANLPTKDVKAMLDCWLDDQDPKNTAKSKWY